MEYSGQYLTYDEYKGLGGTLDLMPFNLLEYKSRKQIDYYTYNRLVNGIPEDIKKDIQMVMMTLIDTNQSIEENYSKSSESIDGYSVSYSGTQEGELKIKNTVTKMLSGLAIDGVPLTYAGGVNDNKQRYYYIP